MSRPTEERYSWSINGARPTRSLTDGSAIRTLAAFDGRRDDLADNAQEGALSSVDPLALVLRTRGVADIWNLATGERRAAFEEPYYARDAAFSHDGARVAVANDVGTVTLRRAADGERLNRWEHGAEVEALAFSPDDRLLASGGEDGTVTIWNAETGEAGPRLRRDGAILSLAFEPRNGTLLSGDAAGALTRFDPASGRILDERRFEGRVSAIDVAPGRLAASVQESEAEAHWEDILFLDRETGAERAQVMRNTNFEAHRLSPDGTFFATWDRRREQLTLWDTATGDELSTIPDVHLERLCLQP